MATTHHPNPNERLPAGQAVAVILGLSALSWAVLISVVASPQSWCCDERSIPMVLTIAAGIVVAVLILRMVPLITYLLVALLALWMIG